MGAKNGRHPGWVEDDRRRLIDERCDRYEAEWRASRSPRIVDYLVGVNGEVRTALWLEIVMLDRELRRGIGEEPTLADYQASCPDAVILLDPSTADLAPMAESPPEGVRRDAALGRAPGAGRMADLAAIRPKVCECEADDGLTRGVGGLAHLIEDSRPEMRPNVIAGPLEPTEGMPGEETGPVGPPETVGTIEGAGELADRADGLAMAGPGCTLGDYVLLEELGHGGMGIVFKAHQKKLNRDVALKMIKTGMRADQREVRLFQIEAEAIAALAHPHIVPILDSGEHRGVLFYSMKLIEGRNLSRLPGPIPGSADGRSPG